MVLCFLYSIFMGNHLICCVDNLGSSACLYKVCIISKVCTEFHLLISAFYYISKMKKKKCTVHFTNVKQYSMQWKCGTRLLFVCSIQKRPNAQRIEIVPLLREFPVATQPSTNHWAPLGTVWWVPSLLGPALMIPLTSDPLRETSWALSQQPTGAQDEMGWDSMNYAKPVATVTTQMGREEDDRLYLCLFLRADVLLISLCFLVLSFFRYAVVLLLKYVSNYVASLGKEIIKSLTALLLIPPMKTAPPFKNYEKEPHIIK